MKEKNGRGGEGTKGKGEMRRYKKGERKEEEEKGGTMKRRGMDDTGKGERYKRGRKKRKTSR